ncbi:MAG: DMT family transporter [Mesorhizobium sp.]|nr:MAG: DMT family transporter [Mesorhizobium sp.]
MKKLAHLAFLMLGIIWGSNFIFVKWAAPYVSPGQIVLLRVMFGFVPVFIYALGKKALSWAHLKHAHHFVVMSLMATSVYYFAYAKGTILLPSSVAGMLSGSIPLFTFVCAWLFLHEEPLSRQAAGGVGLGFLGVLTIARPWTAASFDVYGISFMILGSISVGCSFVYAKKFITPLNLSAVALTTYQIGIAGIMLALITRFPGLGAVFADTRAWIGLVLGLGLCGTGLAYVMYYFIVDNLGAVTASGCTYLPPVVALAIGLAAGEPIDILDVGAMFLIIAGVAILQAAGRHQKI